MVRAAASGKYDFKGFDPFDTWSWRRLRWLLDEVEEAEYRSYLTLQHHFWGLQSLNTDLSAETRDTARHNAHDIDRKILASLFPWLKLDENRARTEQDQILEDYRAEFGQPGDPAYDKMVAELVAQINADTAEIHPEL
jgi:hypothetical protein